MKLRLYEGIFLLNQGFEQVIREMGRMKKSPTFNRQTLQGYQDNIEQLRALTNVEFTYHMQEREHHDAFLFQKKRRVWEKKLADPDDVYVDVEHREEERRKKGLPPRVGIVPYSTVAAEEDRVEAQEEKARRARAKKRRR
jgi:hypothetical protein